MKVSPKKATATEYAESEKTEQAFGGQKVNETVSPVMKSKDDDKSTAQKGQGSCIIF